MKVALKVLLALIVSLCCTEVLLEAFFYNMPPRVHDDQLGMVLQPGRYTSSTEGYCRTMLGPHGMRTPKLGPKQPNEYRVLVLGDSFTEGFQVSDAALFTHQLEVQLQRDRPHTTVINAGKSGLYPGDYIGLASFYQHEFQPDFTVIQLGESDVHQDLTGEGKLFAMRPQGDGFTLVKQDKGSPAPAREGRVKKLAKAVLALSLTRRVMEVKELLNTTTQAISPPAQAGSADKQKHLREQAAKIRWLAAGMKASYPRSVLLYVPELVYYDPKLDLRDPAHPLYQVPDFEQNLNQDCASLGIPLLNMRRTFTEYYLRTLQPVHGFDNTTPGEGHTNALGHRLIAETLYQYLKDHASQPTAQVVSLKGPGSPRPVPASTSQGHSAAKQDHPPQQKDRSAR